MSTPRPPEWQRVESPRPPDRGCDLVELGDAVLTRSLTGPLHVFGRPDLWHRGAVYDSNGHLCVESLRRGGLGGDVMAAADPETISPGLPSRELAGTWLYGGHWMAAFGHFITESLTNLWPRGHELDGLIFHTWLTQDRLVWNWQRRLLDLAGFTGLPIRFVGRRATRVERLVVPARPFVPNGWAHSHAVGVWRRVADGQQIERKPTRVFLSRSLFNDQKVSRGESRRTTESDDHEMDECFAAAGFDVVAPERLDIDVQVRLAANSLVLAGPSGSALHLAGFMRAPGRVIEVGDSRSPDRPLSNQQVINATCGHHSAFIPKGQDLHAALRHLDATWEDTL